MHRFIPAAFVCFVAASVSAQDNGLLSLETALEARKWEAVGRLDMNGVGSCTATLIEPDLVLTAAHCLFDKASQQPIDPENIEFLAGWRNGRASAYRSVKKVVVHPQFVFGTEVSVERVRADIALLKLDHPIRNTTVEPFATAPPSARGDHVGVVSYARDRSESPSLEEVCQIHSAREGVLVTSCSVDFGASGAPIFSFENNATRIVGVVSAKAEMKGEAVSIATDLGQPMEALRAEFALSKNRFRNSIPGVARLTSHQHRQQTGAKFVRIRE